MRRLKRTTNRDYQPLEKRCLLAGDVGATLLDGSLILSGDNQSNEVLISTNSDGNVSVAGQNGTTINGVDEILLDSLVEDLRVFLRGGDDVLFVEDVDIQQRTVVRGGSGSDSIGFLRSHVGDDLRIDSGARADSVSLDATKVMGDLVIKTGSGEDTVGIDESTFYGRTTIRTGGHSDRVAIRNSVHESNVRVSTSGGSDFVSADGLTVNASTKIRTGGRNDYVFVNDTDFASRVEVKGNGGFDTLEVTGNSSFQQAPRAVSFEADDVPGGLPQTDAVFTDLITDGARLGTIVEIAATTPDLSQLVGALQTTGLDQALAGDGPFTVFAPLNSAFDAISGVVAGLSIDQLSDVLLFHVTSGEVFAEQLVTMNTVSTLLGQTFTVDTNNGVVLNGNATLAATDIRAKNGVVHVLNDVLVPVL